MHTHFSFPKYRSAHSVARRAGSIELPTMIAMSATRRRCIHHHPIVSRTGATRRLLEMAVAQMRADVPGNKPGQVDIKKAASGCLFYASPCQSGPGIVFISLCPGITQGHRAVEHHAFCMTVLDEIAHTLELVMRIQVRMFERRFQLAVAEFSQ